jgi:hypothetical protein
MIHQTILPLSAASSAAIFPASVFPQRRPQATTRKRAGLLRIDDWPGCGVRWLARSINVTDDNPSLLVTPIMVERGDHGLRGAQRDPVVVAGHQFRQHAKRTAAQPVECWLIRHNASFPVDVKTRQQ